jgi:RNA polymerase sigma-32 factor
VVEMQQRMEGRDLSLDAPVADGTSTHLEFTASDGEPQDEELARVEEEALVARRVMEAMTRLDPRERHIVEARIMGEGKETLRDLGQHFGFSRERARQLEIRALEKLRRELQPLADEVGWPVSSPADTDL